MFGNSYSKIGSGVLYEELGQDCVPVATNVGVFWPRKGIMRKPGLAVVEFLPRIEAGKDKELFMADPFVRDSESTGTQGDDAVIAALTDALPDHLVPHFVDDWFVFHMGLGEVHCGTNAQRTPAGSWWEDAMHLVEE